MAEPKSDTQSPSRASSRAGSSRRLGRRIAASAVVIFLAYLIGVGVVSVVPQVFWPAAPELDPSIGCEEGLRDLRAELLARAAEHVANGGGDEPALQRFLDGWDLRHRALEDRCEGRADGAWAKLARVRERLEDRLVRFGAEEGALARELDSTLARAEVARD